MQNNNSKTNTVLLAILVILALGIIWFQWDEMKREESNSIGIKEQEIVKNEQPKTVTEGDRKDEEVKPQTNQKTIAIRTILKMQPKSRINECYYQGKTYFSAESTIMADGGTGIYDSNGYLVTSGGGFVPQGTVFPQAFYDIGVTCTNLVYRPYFKDTISGIITPEVDVYKVD